MGLTAQLSCDPARIAVQMIEATSGPSTSLKAVITMEIKSMGRLYKMPPHHRKVGHSLDELGTCSTSMRSTPGCRP